MSQDRPFVHLHCHTHYSLLDGASRIPELAAHVKSLGMNAVAMTDHGNLFGAIEFYSECKKAGLNPIVGYEAYVAHGKRTERQARSRSDAGHHLTLLAKNIVGFRNLVKMASIASLEGYYYVPRIDKDLLLAHREGLICLSGCASSEFSAMILGDRMDEARTLAQWFHKAFGDDFYVEIQNNGIDIQRVCRGGAIDIANRLGLPLVATSDAHYLKQEDARSHDVLLCINTGARIDERGRMRYGNDDGGMVDKFYVCDPDEMYARFVGNGDAVRRSQEIADGCNLELDFKQRHFPAFLPPDKKTPEAYLRELCLQGLKERYGDTPSKEVLDRLEHELGIVCRMGFASYFLIVWDFVRFAREHGIPSGARGSACGAIISYLLGFSHVCPLKHELLFERFLDPNRAEAPDIDIDFCQDRREEVIAYVRDKYGVDSVAQIATFGTLAARAAIRDVGRALNFSLADVDRIAKQVPEKVGTTLDDALAQVPELAAEYNNNERIRDWLDVARKLEGTNRNGGTHAAGVVIADGPLVNHVPLQRVVKKDGGKERTDAAGAITTQWVMGDLEKVGLLKMDFLGLRTLTVIDNAIRLIEKTRGERVNIAALPEGDPDTYALLQRGDTRGVFQFESDGIRELLKRMRPDRLGDIVAATSLYRPGPLKGGMVDAYIDRKHGRQSIPQVHPIMDAILAVTYGVITYQEQAMQVLNQMGGIELASAYAVIKAISKKKQDVIDAKRAEFVRGAEQRGLDGYVADKVFGLIAEFGGYGFNRSHATAYADVTYKTAFLKAHFRSEFTAAVLSSEAGNRDALVGHIHDARRSGVEVLPPDLNVSDLSFTVDEAGRVVFGLGAVKGLGEAANELVEVRTRGGAFRDLWDLTSRVNVSRCGKAALQDLAKAGGLDCLLPKDGHRAQLVEAIPAAVAAASDEQKDLRKGQKSLFESMAADTESQPLPNVPPWSEGERLRQEKSVLDLYLSSHPLALHQRTMQSFATHSVADLPRLQTGTPVIVAGMVSQLRAAHVKSPRAGQPSRYARFRLEDTTAAVECVMWPDVFASEGPALKEDAILYARAAVEVARDQPGLVVQKLIMANDGPQQLACALALRLRLVGHHPSLIDKLAVLLAKYRRDKRRVPVHLVIVDQAGHKAELRAGHEWGVNPAEVNVGELEALLGEGNVAFVGYATATRTAKVVA